ncbi:hypothetical protein BX616_000946 [Lobosporangium transversale]|uniref:MYND-type domain-containing protein n=1 Tax=Lobosporangium transversale TaxID=64571 RepID=A0A1Y2H0R0_9FUNG|nr:hypothetical protein BCR41DRAFT_346644 [Lobosporangium transversale]KAF9905677.1 hypothetical protein BX616_000946 [Lobosporangium transversale]ORZ27313.1 hypothetical protein BCR41DRAFT_346644 [Lobosporangium transversale]|eukprot:XP_021885040.1 hypothetical protein BCR41DRAFT_346644 [Lobosporangium transversale]
MASPMDFFEMLLENSLNNEGAPTVPGDNNGDPGAFMNLTQGQYETLMALYRDVDPDLATKVPILYPELARNFAKHHEDCQSELFKLRWGPKKYVKELEYLWESLHKVGQEFANNECDTEKTRKRLKLKPPGTPMDQLKNVEEVMDLGMLYACLSANSNVSLLTLPHFREGKAYYDYAIEKFKHSWAALQVGSLYMAEFKKFNRKHCLESEDPERIAFEYNLKAAELGNPTGMYRVAKYYEEKLGKLDKAMEWYVEAASHGYPDSAYKLAMLYQEGRPDATPKVEVDLDKAIGYHIRALEYGYGASGTELGRFFFRLSTDDEFRQQFPTTSQYYSSDPKKYLEMAITHLNESNHLLEVESLQLLGKIYSTKEYGRYDIENSQNLYELAFISANGSEKSYELLCNILRVKKAGMQVEPQQVDSLGLRKCGARGCENKEIKIDQFQRCAKCKKVFYCSRNCQVEDWKARHKLHCKK